MKVTLRHPPGEVEFILEGHAPGPPAGGNITCAALSALAYAAAALARSLWRQGRLTRAPGIDLRPGYGRIAARGEVESIVTVAEVAAEIARKAG